MLTAAECFRIALRWRDRRTYDAGGSEEGPGAWWPMKPSTFKQALHHLKLGRDIDFDPAYVWPFPKVTDSYVKEKRVDLHVWFKQYDKNTWLRGIVINNMLYSFDTKYIGCDTIDNTKYNIVVCDPRNLSKQPIMEHV